MNVYLPVLQNYLNDTNLFSKIMPSCTAWWMRSSSSMCGLYAYTPASYSFSLCSWSSSEPWNFDFSYYL